MMSMSRTMVRKAVTPVHLPTLEGSVDKGGACGGELQGDGMKW